jgi:hypothetical protein
MSMENVVMIREILALVISFISLASTGVTAYFAIKTFVQSFKDKKSNEIWNLVMTIADAAMKEAEASQLDGESKKKLVMDTVKAGAEASGLDITAFLTQLDLYIDQTIDFVNKMKNAKN